MDNNVQNNLAFLKPEQREKIRNTTLLFAGIDADTVSIAECALRFGFKKIMLVDDSKVTEEDLCCLNLTNADVGKFKVKAMKSQFQAIFTDANITDIVSKELNFDLDKFRQATLIIVKTLKFSSIEISEYSDEKYLSRHVNALYFCNLGWAGLITVVDPLRCPLMDNTNDHSVSKFAFIRHVANYYRYWGAPLQWLEEMLESSSDCNLPQLSIGTWILGGLVTNVLYDIAIGNNVMYYPQFYMMSIKK